MYIILYANCLFNRTSWPHLSLRRSKTTRNLPIIINRFEISSLPLSLLLMTKGHLVVFFHSYLFSCLFGFFVFLNLWHLWFFLGVEQKNLRLLAVTARIVRQIQRLLQPAQRKALFRRKTIGEINGWYLANHNTTLCSGPLYTWLPTRPLFASTRLRERQRKITFQNITHTQRQVFSSTSLLTEILSFWTADSRFVKREMNCFWNWRKWLY